MNVVPVVWICVSLFLHIVLCLCVCSDDCWLRPVTMRAMYCAPNVVLSWLTVSMGWVQWLVPCMEYMSLVQRWDVPVINATLVQDSKCCEDSISTQTWRFYHPRAWLLLVLISRISFYVRSSCTQTFLYSKGRKNVCNPYNVAGINVSCGWVKIFKKISLARHFFSFSLQLSMPRGVAMNIWVLEVCSEYPKQFKGLEY